MTFDTPDIDVVVREVVRRLRAALDGPGPASQSRGEVPASDQRESAETWCMSSRLLTLPMLTDRLDRGNRTIREVVVPHRAVVTPAVRDELKRRAIKLRFGPAGVKSWPAGANIETTFSGVKLLAAETTYDCTSLIGLLNSSVITADRFGSTCLDEAVREMRLAAERAIRTVCLTDRPATLLCLANRDQGIRAAELRPTDVDEIQMDLDPNAWVADPRKWSLIELRNGIRKTIQQEQAR